MTFVSDGSHKHGHTSMSAGVLCKHCGHDSSHHVQQTGTDDDLNDHPCWFGIAQPWECEGCPGFEPAAFVSPSAAPCGKPLECGGRCVRAAGHEPIPCLCAGGEDCPV